MRLFIYNYHLNGLDLLQEDKNGAIKKIMTYLIELQQMDKQKLGSIFPNIYFSAKADEIVNVLSLGNAQDKIKAYHALTVIDPANISKYEELKKN